MKFHESVLLGEVVELLAPAPGKLFVDGTLGGGGHTAAFLEAGATVIGLDQDPEALMYSRERLRGYGDQFQAVKANFAELGRVLDDLGIEKIDGAIMDIGVSSWQLDSAARGFSLMRNGPLDMRMDPENPVTAADLVNTLSEKELERIFCVYGEEPAARRLAMRVVEARPLHETLDLVKVVESVIPKRGKVHPATRIFQALRIAVNKELEVLEEGLKQFSGYLNTGGRLGVITFHSLEDRIVKNFFKSRSVKWLDRPEWPAPRPNPEYQFKLLSNKPVVATPDEEKRNPRSRSAKLRVVEKII